MWRKYKRQFKRNLKRLGNRKGYIRKMKEVMMQYPPPRGHISCKCMHWLHPKGGDFV